MYKDKKVDTQNIKPDSTICQSQESNDKLKILTNKQINL